MAYSELIKSFERIREYMRQFYVFGFKNRSEYDAKSARSYDNERRRIESWLGEYMSFGRNADGKNMFIALDSRSIEKNPLYNAFKAKSFTVGDITFHFYILDLLADGKAYTVGEITDALADRYTSAFEDAEPIDESILRKKLKEYTQLGLIIGEKRGRELTYKLSSDGIDIESFKEAVAFFSEENPLGVIGSFIMDKYGDYSTPFRFKHHYILGCIDSQIVYDIADAASKHKYITVSLVGRGGIERKHVVYPVRVFVSTQSGRQYLLCYHYRFKRMMSLRLDNIRSVKAEKVDARYERFEGYYQKLKANMWGMALNDEPDIDHIEMDILVGEGEEYIVERLYRERRCGKVERLKDGILRFTADVYDAMEMLPWIRTFIGRIERLSCTNRQLVELFDKDLEAMAKLYGGDTDAVQ